MNERQNSPSCERAPDLIAYVYGEADEREARDFQLHLQQCTTCRAEAASFGVVRESITSYRDEALAGFVSTPVVTQQKTKSALAALRQFFDLSPLWLKGATALAAVTFCVLAGLVLFRNKDHVIPTNVNPNAIYTGEDVHRIVQEALAKQQKPSQAGNPPQVVAVQSTKPKPKSARVATSTQSARNQRPLSKAEREQLAAELRLVTTGDDATVLLVGDRINQ